MKVELLNQPPVSGSIPERWFDGVGACTWVRFEPSTTPTWAGVFGGGDIIRASTVVSFADARHVLVLARGIGYVVDGESGDLRYRTASDLLIGGLTVPDRDFVIACSWTHLFALGTSEELWSRDIALDGIELVSATPSTLRGEAWQGSAWHEFTLYYDGWRHGEHGLVRA